MATKKLLAEFAKFQETESEEYEVSNPQDDGNVFKWEVMIFGPPDSPYDGGMFFVKMEFPDTYPEHPPKKVAMQTKIYHPNIDFKGEICFQGLKDNWNNKMNVKTVIDYLLKLIKNPDYHEAINSEVAEVMQKDMDKYKKLAAEWTEKYAT
eukprot:CAMPEP_0184502956 /NCGR_PEP_ID=MMETSP0113_2-20130426/51588_1 /TAXON_ID=91329 /ORGANISM="Norrisiella sphaerica, Strain BC52" /LENGTH=150 /DNA_ID=CAMNT_0026892331 /DNA_START=56 /DNA_END=508 /DNA_ORIENTATION=+